MSWPNYLFTHIIQIGKSMKISTRIPAFYFQGFSYEDDKRDDVLNFDFNLGQ